jgi:hypothetical protein
MSGRFVRLADEKNGFHAGKQQWGCGFAEWVVFQQQIYIFFPETRNKSKPPCQIVKYYTNKLPYSLRNSQKNIAIISISPTISLNFYLDNWDGIFERRTLSLPNCKQKNPSCLSVATMTLPF